jgi:hypothetical protein
MENPNFAEVGIRSTRSPHVLLYLTRFFTSNFGVRVKRIGLQGCDQMLQRSHRPSGLQAFSLNAPLQSLEFTRRIPSTLN